MLAVSLVFATIAALLIEAMVDYLDEHREEASVYKGR
jgi:hypothetical protein